MLPTIQSIFVDIDDLSEVRLSRRPPVAGTDSTVSVQVPGLFPGRIVHADLAAGGPAQVVEGILASDAPLRFVRADGSMRAESFDGSLVYQAHERIPAAAPWSPERVEQGCCGWWERTLWRAAPGAPGAGLLRAVSPPLGHWSVIDWYLPGILEPAWRLQITEKHTIMVAAAVSPRADQIVVVLADKSGKAIARALAPQDGRTLWTTELERPAAEWRRDQGRMVYSFDGTRFAVVVQDLARCEACSAIAVFDSRTGKHIRTVSIKTILSPESSSLGINGNSVWIFEHVLPKEGHRANRPERCQYEIHDLSTGARRSIDKTAASWGLEHCRTWALLPRFGKDGVVGLDVPAPTLIDVLVADDAP